MTRSASSGARQRGRVRCATYTRKSSEEGLEQEFNSLQAQREACEAFITSQRQEGWVCLRTGYDVGEQPLQSRPTHRRAGEPAVIIPRAQAHPTFLALAGDKGLASLALRLQRIEFLFEPLLGGFAGQLCSILT